MTSVVPTPTTRPAPLSGATAHADARAPKSLNRFEIKYLVHHSVAREMMRELAGYTTPDRNASSEWGYRVYSVYWDSPDLRCFWEKVEGVSFRRKLRVRRYGESDDGFIEIKQRIDRTLQKRRARMPLDRALQLLDPRLPDESVLAASGGIGGEVIAFRRSYALRPTAAVSYRRRAFFGAHDAHLRITFDTRVQYSTAMLDPRRPFTMGKYVIDPRLAIMEVKFGDRVPRWLCSLICSHDLQMTRLSKYCTAIDRAYYQGRTTPLF